MVLNVNLKMIMLIIRTMPHICTTSKPMEFNYSRVLLREQLILECEFSIKNGTIMICKVNNGFYRSFDNNGYDSPVITIIFNVIDNGLIESNGHLRENGVVYGNDNNNDNEIWNGMHVSIFFLFLLQGDYWMLLFMRLLLK